MLRIVELAGYPVHVMVVHKIVQLQVAINPALPKLAVECVGNFKVIPVHQAGIKPLVTFIIRHRVQDIRVCPLPVISMDHLPHQPEIRAERACEIRQFALEIQVQAICHIQPQAINSKIRHPMSNSFQDVLPGFRVV